jgi:sugar lactone lactonase YvrE
MNSTRKDTMSRRAISNRGRLLLAAVTVLAVGTTAATAASEAATPATKYKLVASWGKNGTGDGQFLGATGIGIDSQGAVYLANSSNYRIDKFDASGKFLMKWGTRGDKAQGQFTTPHDVAIDTAGNVWVADYGNTRLQRFTTSGGVPGDGKRTIITGLDSQPDTVGVDSAGNLFVTEFFANKVRRYDAATNWAVGTVWGGTGTGAGQFNRPHGVAISPDGSVYVGDRDNYRTQRFDTNGKFLNGWGSNGIKPGQFRQAVGTAVDIDCNVWVADSDAHRLQKFNSAGKLLDQIANVFAIDVAISPNGDIYTLENPGVDQRIERFHETPGVKPANAPKVLNLDYDKKTKTFHVSVPYIADNATCPTELAATASLKTLTGKALGTKAGLQLTVNQRTTIDIPIAKAAILKAGFKTAGSSKVAKTRLSVILKTNGRNTLTVKDGTLRISIAAIKSGALPGLKGLLK